MKKSLRKQFEEKGGKKPSFPPISWAIVQFSLFFILIGTAITGLQYIVAWIIGGLLFTMFLGLSIWSEMQFRRYKIDIPHWLIN